MASNGVPIINQSQLSGDVIIKGNASKVKFALKSTFRGEFIL